MVDRPHKPRVLDYSPRPKHLRRSAGAALFGLLLAFASGLFGLLMLIVGMPGLIHVLRKGNRNSPAFEGDVFEGVMFIIIGLFCTFIAIRWTRATLKILKDAKYDENRSIDS